MKKLLLSLLLLVICTPSFAGVTATFGDQNSSGLYRVAADTDGVVTFQSNTGILWPYEAATTSDTLTAYETGKTIVATAAATFTLPTAAPGMQFTVIAGTNKVIALDPASGDRFYYGANGFWSNGDRIWNTSSTTGDSVTIFSTTANRWDVRGIVGTWADAN